MSDKSVGNFSVNGSGKRKSRRRLASDQKLSFHQLEDRRMLATFVVSNVLDGPVDSARDLPGSLRQAVFDANASAGADTIEFDAGVFTEGLSSLIRLTSGELEITESLTIDGSAGVDVTITGDANGNDVTNSLNITDVAASGDALLADNSRVFNFSAPGQTLQLDGLTVTGGRTMRGANAGGGILVVGSVALTNSTVSGNSTAGYVAYGGGISAFNGSVTLTNSAVTGNSTGGEDSSGGGIFAFGGGNYSVTLINSMVSDNSTAGEIAHGGGINAIEGDVTLTNSTVSGNRTAGGDARGGGIRVYRGNLTVANSTVSGNSTAGDRAYGGGINAFEGSVTLTNSTVSDNYTTGVQARGGGIRVYSGDFTLTNSTVSGNSTAGDYADSGGIYAFGGGSNGSYSLTLTNSTVSSNFTAGDRANGGGITAFDGNVTLISSTVSGNSTAGFRSSGGGIYAAAVGVTLVNSTVSSNSATGDNARGGGIYAPFDSSLTLTNSTVSGNSATGPGGGIDAADLTIMNSIVAGNIDNGTGPEFRASGDVTVGSSLIGDNTGTGLAEAQTADGNGNLIGSNLFPIDPLLGPLAFNGGSTQTHALLPGSPAIDGGNSPLATDQRGVSRGVDLPGVPNASGDNFADIGSFERQVAEPIGVLPVVTSFVRDEGGVLARPDLLDTFSVSFNVAVNVSPDDLIIRNESNGGTLVDTSSLTVDFDELTNTATWDFTSLVLDPSFYSFELSDYITSMVDNLGLDGDEDGIAGGTYEIGEVYVALPGDANLDGQVDVLNDGFALVGNLETNAGAGWADGDFNGDGSVDVLVDAFVLVGQLGQLVVPSTFLVSNVLDGPVTAAGDLPGSLRQAVFDANASSGANTIEFDASVFAGGSSSAAPIDPLLGPLAFNGGPTQTHALLPGSPAIDAGSDALAVDGNGDPLVSDQRGTGFDRIVDIGAFEFAPGFTAKATSVLPSNLGDDRDALLDADKQVVPQSESSKLGLSGAHDLRDDVFGSGFYGA